MVVHRSLGEAGSPKRVGYESLRTDPGMLALLRACHAELPPPAHSAHRGPGIGPPHPVQKSELSKPLSAIKSPQVLQCDNEKLIGSLLKAKVNFYFLLFKRQRWAGGGGREGERERDPSPIH